MMNNSKFKYFIAATFLSVASFSFAQVRIVNSATNSAVNNSSSFIDASSNSTTNATTNVGKGLIFPRTDLTTFTAFSGSPVGLGTSFPTRFDGMVVYNTATGGVAGAGATSEALFPGFWYYDNKSATTTGGTWKPLIGSSKFNVVDGAAAGVATSTQVDGAQVYAYKGQFTTTGSSTAVTLAVPTGLTAMYGITIFKKAASGNKVVFSKELYSFDSTNGAAVTGSPSMSVVYPADTYDYIIEYFK